MRQHGSYIGLGILLVGVGLLMLAQNFGIIASAWGVLWAILFAAGGLAFLAVFAANREHWWAIIPGFTLLGLAALIGITTLLPNFPAAWGGTLFLGTIGLSFWVVYLLRPDNWWAVIPGGVMITLALVAGLSNDGNGIQMGGIFFLGLALTFGLVYLLPTPEGRMRWAIIPAGILGFMGLMLLASMGQFINYLWPAALIIGGVYLLLRAMSTRSRL